ncbi:MAG: tRNA lysidine(34) synthetase TilS [Christensenellaceae bacterium]|jgi:tRNA(Ile)-lysidine synthase|nr:tRNA lysidine(34) synthetase TilS [Christensenellaceae bacterium]
MNITFDKTKKIGIGVSGGVDSMVLLEIVSRQHANILVINIDHGIRGAESKRDSEFVINYCKNNNIECVSKQCDAPAFAKSQSISIELAARTLRYQIFDQMLKEKLVDTIALAHHLNDQVETLLFRIFRGAGTRGLRGIVDRDGYIHPLLTYTKHAIELYAQENGVIYVNDSTNDNLEYSRNFIRNALIPLIKDKFPNYTTSLLRIASNMQEVDDFLSLCAIPFVEYDGKFWLPVTILNEHPALAKKSISNLLRAMNVDKNIHSSHYDNILKLKHSENNSKLILPNYVVVVKEYDKLVFYNSKDLEQLYGYCYNDFQIEKIYTTPYHIISSCCTNKIEFDTFDADKLPEGCSLRVKKDGDIFTKFGGGTKSLSDYFTDIKLPITDRRIQPIIAKDNIVYAMPGLAISEHLRIDKFTRKIYKFDIRKLPTNN